MPGGRGLEQVCVAAPRMLSGRQARMIHLTARLPVGRKGPQDPLRKVEFAEGSGEQRRTGLGPGSQQEDEGCKRGRS